jgi:hypothetical protein
MLSAEQDDSTEINEYPRGLRVENLLANVLSIKGTYDSHSGNFDVAIKHFGIVQKTTMAIRGVME